MRSFLKKFLWWNRISIFKSLLINFYCLPFNQAIRFPIYVYSNTLLKSLGGIKINAPVCRGMIRIGTENFFAGKKTIILNYGEIIFKGNALLMHGCSLYNSGTIVLGESIMIGETVKISIVNKLKIGNYTQIGFDSVILDTDFHTTINTKTNEVSKNIIPVEIGEWNWFGHSCTVHKGVKTADYSIVANNSLLNKDYTKSVEPLLAGAPAKIIRNNIRRIYNPTSEKDISAFFAENPETNLFKAEIGIKSIEDFILKEFQLKF